MFREIFEKVAAGVALTPTEQNEFARFGERLQLMESVVSSWLQPGSDTPSFRDILVEGIKLIIQDGDLTIDENGIHVDLGVGDGITIDENGIQLDVGGGVIVMDSTGILFPNNQLSAFAFASTLGADDDILIFTDAFDALTFMNKTGNTGGMRWFIDTANHEVLTLGFIEGLEDEAQFDVGLGPNGARLTMGGEMELHAENSGAGLGNYISMRPSTATPPDPSDGHNDVHMYTKGSKLIFQFNDGGTVRYKYLDLSGTGTTWVHTTTAP
jgi:hypothetical protein